MSTHGHIDGSNATPPPELLSCLWDKYCTSLVDCHYDHDAVVHVWDAFGAVLTDLCPLQLPALLTHASHSTDGDDDGIGAVGADVADMCNAGLLLFEVPWCRLDSAQQQAIVDVPLTLLPMLEFLRAVVAWRAATSASTPGRHVDVRVTRLQVLIRGGMPTPFRALGAGVINQTVFVQGTIIRMSSPRVVCARMPFRCVLCGATRVVDVEGGPLLYPSACAGKCRGYFSPMLDMAETEEVQLVKLQEMLQLDGAASSGPGHPQQQHGGGDAVVSPQQQQGMHRVLEVELRGVWIDVATAGDVIAVCGVGCTRRGDKQSGVGMRHLSLKVVSLTSLGNGSTRLGGAGRSRSDAAALVNKNYTYEKVAQFFELAKHPSWFDRLVASMAPGIMGLTDVKAAMLLALAGGTVKAHARSNIHVLMVGDPGLGKSQLLRAVCGVAPRSSMATANTSSSCGLTITLSRDPQTGETTFEAGAVVHGDGGVTCIDEIDKGAAEHKALLEVMEQGTISIAKAGTLFSMHVDTSVLAAGNPVGGRFQSAKSLSENINISAPLLSRFDVIFLMQSLVQGSTTSHHITSHVLDMHRAEGSTKDGGGKRTQQPVLLPQALMTEFLQYARDTCRPVMTAAAALVLRDAYLEARRTFSVDTTQLPITPRYLQSLIRISEAKAKLDLRREVSEADAKFAVGLLISGAKSYMEGGACNQRSSSSQGTGVGGSKKLSQRDMAMANMERVLLARGVDALSHDEAIACCADAGCKNPNLMLQQLNEYGGVLMTAGKYRLRRKL